MERKLQDHECRQTKERKRKREGKKWVLLIQTQRVRQKESVSESRMRFSVKNKFSIIRDYIKYDQ